MSGCEKKTAIIVPYRVVMEPKAKHCHNIKPNPLHATSCLPPWITIKLKYFHLWRTRTFALPLINSLRNTKLDTEVNINLGPLAGHLKGPMKVRGTEA